VRRQRNCYGHQVFQQLKEEKLRLDDVLETQISDTEMCLKDTVTTTV
jgi:hypothetical protein